AVRMAAGKIVPGVVGGGIESRRFGAAEAAIPALQDVAAVALEAQDMLGGAVAGRAKAHDLREARRRESARCKDWRWLRPQGAWSPLDLTRSAVQVPT